MFRCHPLLRTIRALVLCGISFMFAAVASATWKENVLYSFQGDPDGAQPYAGVVFDKAGNLYGTTGWGGGSSCGGPAECGTVFQLRPQQKGGAWTENILYTFKGEPFKDGDTPQGGLIIDEAGNLYGTTAYGGAGNCQLLGGTVGCGIVFEMSPPALPGGAWTYAILYSFQGNNDGQYPQGNLTFDRHGNLYGATQFGGGQGYNNCNKYYGYCGTIFRLSPPKQKSGAWTENVLYSFKGVGNDVLVGDGSNPNGGLILDSKGAIYGTTYFGGDNAKGTCLSGQGGTGCGTVFKLEPPTEKGGAWTETQIHAFRGGSDSRLPAAGLSFDGNARLYGTTIGTVFCLTPPKKGAVSWRETILYTFTKNEFGPMGAPIFDNNGNLYDTTYSGQTFSGTVFRLRPPGRKGGEWAFDLLYGFAGAPDGGQPAAGLIFDGVGNLYGTTFRGGTGNGSDCSHGCGTVFEVGP